MATLKKIKKNGFKDQFSLNAGQKYSAILSTFIKLPFVIKLFVLSIFEWLFYTGFTLCNNKKAFIQKDIRKLVCDHIISKNI